ncbi:polysaccharide biosynthesis tyrosine autokinase [Frankia sp. Ag45/Mut15]|uniref:Polysaccharide biosynthesis tyrosine autokinase n=1 Tax=Frankia umida TaxID=573489 RepID=A0ABT0JXL2_9ACTN|nr:polysaccharide biosynthesis tyrosine autokinase [Frankia umida]MCK9876289.1 polysaccharide biosynthesis tyrosine autokinase [Frankia umida]
MELRDYVRVLRRSWMLILAIVVLGGGLAGLLTWRSAKVYAASVTMVVSSPDNADGAASAYQGGLLSQQRVKSYANLVASDRVAGAVIDRLRLRITPEELRSKIIAAAVPDTVLLKATIQDRDPRQAQAIADAVGTEFSRAVAEIEAPTDSESPPTVRVSVWERSKLPTSPVSPQPTRNYALGILLGLILGVGAAVLRFRLDTSLTGQEDAREATDLPNLAMIIFDADTARHPLITSARPHSARAEAFRQLRTNLQFVDVDADPRSIIVSSAVPGEGKTTTVCNLAISLAQSGHRVCLIEGDLRRPSFSAYLGVESAAGLTSVLIGAADLDDVLQPWGEGRVGSGRIEVLASGPVPPNPSELLGSRNMADLLDVLHARFDFVLIDAPPLLPVTDAAVLASRADGVLLVARIGKTRREQLRQAADALRAVDARVVGTVLNMVPTKGPDAHYYGQYSSYVQHGRHTRGAERARRSAATEAGVRPSRPSGTSYPLFGSDPDATPAHPDTEDAAAVRIRSTRDAYLDADDSTGSDTTRAADPDAAELEDAELEGAEHRAGGRAARGSDQAGSAVGSAGGRRRGAGRGGQPGGGRGAAAGVAVPSAREPIDAEQPRQQPAGAAAGTRVGIPAGRVAAKPTSAERSRPAAGRGDRPDAADGDPHTTGPAGADAGSDR